MFELASSHSLWWFFFQEEGLRKSGEPKYAHLSMELHVFIEVFAPVPEAYLRMAHAMEEVKKFLFPVSLPVLLLAFCELVCVEFCAVY